MIKEAKAAVYTAPGTPFVINSYPLRSVKNDEILVQVSMASICRSDIHSYQGHRPNPCPGILGHEIVGVVRELGQHIKFDLRGDPLALGDRITWMEYYQQEPSYYADVLNLPQKSPGVRKYGHDLVEKDPHFNGGFGEYCYVMPGTGVLKIPDELSDAEAAPLNCGVATMASVIEAAAIALGDTVVIQGLGLLGLYGCAIAKSRGARKVIGIDVVPDRRALARKFGADLVIDLTAMDEKTLIDTVRSECRPDGADVIIEVSGNPGAVASAIPMLRCGGRYILAGLVNPESCFSLDGNDLIRKLITIKGVHNYHPRHLVQALDFVMSHRQLYPFAELVDAVFSLEQINDAFTQASARQVLRAAIIPGNTGGIHHEN
ncbi:MAG: zinc-binding dehydrogenase [Pelovirga sp.]